MQGLPWHEYITAGPSGLELSDKPARNVTTFLGQSGASALNLNSLKLLGIYDSRSSAEPYTTNQRKVVTFVAACQTQALSAQP